jgi:hypothetical protein
MTPVTAAPWAMGKMFSTALKQDFQKTTIPCRIVCSDCSPELPLRGDKSEPGHRFD